MEENDDLFDIVSDEEDASLLGLPEEVIDILKDNSTQTTLNGEDFYIISVGDIQYEYKKQLGENLEWNKLERLCNAFLGQWGTDDEWSVCDICYKPIYTGDYYEQDYWYPECGGVICGDCTRKDPEEYLKSLENTTGIASLVDGDVLKDYGYELDTVLSYFDRLSIIEDCIRRYPNDKFIFGVNCGDVCLYRKEGDNNEED